VLADQFAKSAGLVIAEIRDVDVSDAGVAAIGASFGPAHRLDASKPFVGREFQDVFKTPLGQNGADKPKLHDFLPPDRSVWPTHHLPLTLTLHLPLSVLDFDTPTLSGWPGSRFPHSPAPPGRRSAHTRLQDRREPLGCNPDRRRRSLPRRRRHPGGAFEREADIRQTARRAGARARPCPDRDR